MSSYLDKTGLERVWSKATNKFATIATTDELRGNIETLTSTKADKTEVETAVAGLVDSAPETLNTLNELSAALGDDPNFATTISTQIGNKVDKNTYNDEVSSLRANINEKLPLSGGVMDGVLQIGRESNTESAPNLKLVRSVNSIKKTGTIYLHSSDGSFMTQLADGSTTVNYLKLYSDKTVLLKPLTIESGGTGASTISGVRENLNVPSRTGENASGSWGIDITGNAATATALTTSAGSTSKPVYFTGGKPVAINNLILGDETSNTYRDFQIKRKSSSDDSYGKFYIWLSTTGKSAGLEFQHFDATGTKDGAAIVQLNSSHFIPGSDGEINLGASNYKWNTIYATTFNGSGASLTSLNASNISSGTIAAARLPASGVTAGTYGPSAAVTGNNNATMNVPEITVDSYGRVTSITNRVYTAKNTTYTIPTSLKNPNALTVVGGSTTCYSYDGSAAKTLTIKAGSNITVTGDTSGNITIANSYSYSLPTASSSTKGGVKIGSNITVSSGTISLSKTNVTDALGYTPPTTNTTYSNATTSAAGLMSSTDKSKLDAITASADSVSFTRSLTTGTKIGTITINGTGTDLYCETNTNTTYSQGTTSTLGLIRFGYGALSSRPSSASAGTIYLATS